jgi:hypothetical protein
MRKAFNSEQLEPLIFRIRGRRVVLDADLARLYGVTTTRFNEAFRRNRHRFPGDFAFQITADELENLRSQIAISSLQSTDSPKDSSRRSQFVTASHGGRRYLPWAFTEHGALMAANILRSEGAVRMSVFVVRAFVRLREQVAANLSDLYRKLLPLLQPPADPPKRRIGFHTDND